MHECDGGFENRSLEQTQDNWNADSGRLERLRDLRPFNSVMYETTDTFIEIFTGCIGSYIGQKCVQWQCQWRKQKKNQKQLTEENKLSYMIPLLEKT